MTPWGLRTWLRAISNFNTHIIERLGQYSTVEFASYRCPGYQFFLVPVQLPATNQLHVYKCLSGREASCLYSHYCYVSSVITICMDVNIMLIHDRGDVWGMWNSTWFVNHYGVHVQHLLFRNIMCTSNVHTYAMMGAVCHSWRIHNNRTLQATLDSRWVHQLAS